MPLYPIILLLTILSGPGTRQAQQQVNHLPEIKVTKPSSPFFDWNSMLTYAIHVRDQEDGDTDFGEIPKEAVILTVRYVSDSLSLSKVIQQESSSNIQLLLKMSYSDCFNCHAARTKLIGPSLQSIAAKYNSNPATIAELAKSVLEGSSGKWGEAIMPTHPDLTEKDAQDITRWILENGKDESLDYFRGTEGTFKTPQQLAPKTFLVLTAFYTDKGLDAKPGTEKKATASCVLKSR